MLATVSGANSVPSRRPRTVPRTSASTTSEVTASSNGPTTASTLPGVARRSVSAASEVGLDPVAAREVLASGRYTDEVRAAERHWQQLGIQAVPSVVIDGRHLIQGGQPAEAFEQALRQIAAGG